MVGLSVVGAVAATPIRFPNEMALSTIGSSILRTGMADQRTHGFNTGRDGRACALDQRCTCPLGRDHVVSHTLVDEWGQTTLCHDGFQEHLVGNMEDFRSGGQQFLRQVVEKPNQGGYCVKVGNL